MPLLRRYGTVDDIRYYCHYAVDVFLYAFSPYIIAAAAICHMPP